jgi:cytosine/adenosine deaminase-related metal-dependent hydrolase
MRSSHCSGITFVNAQLSGGEISSVRVAGSVIAELGAAPHAGDRVVDLLGDRILPGLINSHDHLQLNSLPRPESAKRYRHVREWIAEVDAHRMADPAFEAGVAVARDERLVIGGIKNLLSGATTVAHHDPLYPGLLNDAFPTAVVENYGWSHSTYVDGEESVVNSYRRTSHDRPWIIHAAEGLDDAAREEFERLDALGCLGPNTLLVHGVALTRAQRIRLKDAAAGLIWCPSSNLALFGRTAGVAELVRHGCVALGTDSRLSGARDLLDELRVAAEVGGLDTRDLERIVTSNSVRLLRLPDRGVLRAGLRADLLILPARIGLGSASRADVRLVLRQGVVRYGDYDIAHCTEPASHWADVRVDGRTKILDGRIAALLAGCGAREPGLELQNLAWRAA